MMPSGAVLCLSIALFAAGVVTLPLKAHAQAIDKIFDNGNIYLVENGATRATEFSLASSVRLAKIMTYHWNNGRGAPPGTVALKSRSGQTFGPWRARGEPGQGGVPNAYWIVEPQVVLSAGSYTVIDSDPSTWAQNALTGGSGIASVHGTFE